MAMLETRPGGRWVGAGLTLEYVGPHGWPVGPTQAEGRGGAGGRLRRPPSCMLGSFLPLGPLCCRHKGVGQLVPLDRA